MRDLRHKTIWLIIGWLLIVSIVFLSLYPMPSDTPGLINDKVVHFIMYLGLMAWFVQIYNHTPSLVKLGLAFTMLGLILELLQGLLPSREFSIFDAVANGIGVFAGFILIFTPATKGLEWLEELVD